MDSPISFWGININHFGNLALDYSRGTAKKKKKAKVECSAVKGALSKAVSKVK